MGRISLNLFVAQIKIQFGKGGKKKKLSLEYIFFLEHRENILLRTDLGCVVVKEESIPPDVLNYCAFSESIWIIEGSESTEMGERQTVKRSCYVPQWRIFASGITVTPIKIHFSRSFTYTSAQALIWHTLFTATMILP